ATRPTTTGRPGRNRSGPVHRCDLTAYGPSSRGYVRVLGQRASPAAPAPGRTVGSRWAPGRDRPAHPAGRLRGGRGRRVRPTRGAMVDDEVLESRVVAPALVGREEE